MAGKAGRPTKLTSALQKTICKAVAIGATYQAAAEHAGITYKTFCEWMVRGESTQEPLYFAFRDAVTQANAQCKITLLEKIQRAKDWRSKAWILERRFPDEYGQVVKFGKMTDDELRAYIADQLARLGAGDGGGAAAGDGPAEDADAGPI